MATKLFSRHDTLFVAAETLSVTRPSANDHRLLCQEGLNSALWEQYEEMLLTFHVSLCHVVGDT